MTKEKVFISEADQYLFAQGTHYDIYKKLGAHLSTEDGVQGVYFGVWAPNAAQVNVIGTFNEWNEESHPMQKLGEGGIWGLFIPGVEEGTMYKFLIYARDGRKLYKADPFANYAEYRPGTASIVTDITGFDWRDSKWMEARDKKDMNKEPMAIYECHIGSFMKHPNNGTAEGFYNYREFADRIIEYLKEMKYTHVELMGIAEHPFDGSWGYQVTGYYAPTSRYGTPKDFMYLINELHKAGVGVILDWVPAHFATDAHGLAEFDGQCIFEHPDPRLGEHPEWGTKIFNYGKNEVKDFLISNALYWVEEYHVDGLRVDAVASMLYLDYDRAPGEWKPNRFGDHGNLEAIAFFKKLNGYMRSAYPDVLMIAEESTAWENVTRFDGDGLGFHMKWNMGWMNDALSYASTDPLFRKGNHSKITFSMMYAFSEYYVLPISHDEVVHGKKSLLDRFPGLYGQKFDGMRAFLIYMMTHPGKKLLFMGCENGQFTEWNYEKEVEWFLLDYEQHKKMHAFVRDLNRLYLAHSELWQADDSWDGFEWIEVDNADESIIAIRRKNRAGDALLTVVNFTPVERPGHILHVPAHTSYSMLLDSSDEKYGGYKKTTGALRAKKQKDGSSTISLDLPALGAVILKEKSIAKSEKPKQ